MACWRIISAADVVLARGSLLRLLLGHGHACEGLLLLLLLLLVQGRRLLLPVVMLMMISSATSVLLVLRLLLIVMLAILWHHVALMMHLVWVETTTWLHHRHRSCMHRASIHRYAAPASRHIGLELLLLLRRERLELLLCKRL